MENAHFTIKIEKIEERQHGLQNKKISQSTL
jgi:hypothetical protein